MATKRVIIILADGARPDVLEDLLNRGRLPNIQRYIIDPGTYLRAVTAFPSTTGPAYMPFLTGCLPATCNVPGIRWFDKGTFKNCPSASLPQPKADPPLEDANSQSSRTPMVRSGCSLAGRLASGQFLKVPLNKVFRGIHGKDRYRSYVGLETFHINSDMRSEVKTIFELTDDSYCIFNSISRGAGPRNLTRVMRIWYWYYAHLTDHWAFVDEVASRKMIKALDNDPRFIFVVFPGIDEYSHIADPKHPSATDGYERIDKAVLRLVAGLEKRGWMDDTMIWIVSDHGLSSTHTHFCINDFLEGRGLRTLFYPLTFKKKCVAANMMSGNGMTHLYFRNDDGWARPTTVEELHETHGDVVEGLIKNRAVAVVAGRNYKDEIAVFSKFGRARISLEAGHIRYKINGRDPFGYAFQSQPLHADDYLAETMCTDYPDAPYQLAHIFTSPRCGDLVVSAEPGFDLRLKYEVPEHKGTHGSLHKEHMLVPLLCNLKLEARYARTVDVFPTYLKFLGLEVPSGIDGRSLI